MSPQEPYIPHSQNLIVLDRLEHNLVGFDIEVVFSIKRLKRFSGNLVAEAKYAVFWVGRCTAWKSPKLDPSLGNRADEEIAIDDVSDLAGEIEETDSGRHRE